MTGYGTGGVADWRAAIAIDSRRMRAAANALMVPRHERQDPDREIQDLPMLDSQLLAADHVRGNERGTCRASERTVFGRVLAEYRLYRNQ